MDCPPGEYCEGLGNTLPTGLCDAGFYCGGKSYQKRPFDTGNLTTINGTLRFVNIDDVFETKTKNNFSRQKIISI